MHEVSIAQNIIDKIEFEVRTNKASRVKNVKLVIGEFTGIVKEALEFALEIITKNTSAENACFDIETVKLKTYCSQCNKSYSDNGELCFICPVCDSNLKILEGRELLIKYIDVE